MPSICPPKFASTKLLTFARSPVEITSRNARPCRSAAAGSWANTPPTAVKETRTSKKDLKICRMCVDSFEMILTRLRFRSVEGFNFRRERDFTFDGKETVTSAPGPGGKSMPVRTSSKWEGSKLILTTSPTVPSRDGGEATVVIKETWELAPDGKL